MNIVDKLKVSIRLWSLLLMVCVAFGAIADINDVGKLKVTLKDGSELVIPLADSENNPIDIQFSPDKDWDDENFIMVLNGKINVFFGGYYYQFDDVAKYNVIPSDYGVDSLVNSVPDVLTPKIRFVDATTLSLSGLIPYSKLLILSIDGRTFLDFCADSQGDAVISLSNLQSGVYVLAGDNISFKFMKK